MSWWEKVRVGAQSFFEERGIESGETFARSRLHRYAHFWLLVGKSFIRNRCPVRASALAYTTLLALVPLLAVGVSITTSILQKRGEVPVQEMLSKLIGYVAPALDLETRPEDESILPTDTNRAPSVLTNAALAILGTNSSGGTNLVAPPSAGAPAAMTGQQRIVKQITAFIANINSGTLGTTSVLALLFVGISLLRTIEATLNDIWGVTQGRGWFKSIVYYWAAITLGPLFLVGAITITTQSHLESTREWLNQLPIFGTLLFKLVPFVILSLGFAAFYAMMPNTKVQLKAALVGGIIGGSLWQLNNLFSVVYVSRVLTYTSIYGSLGVFPIFLVGMYFSWLIMLLGAQVAYAYQNREAYIAARQAESVNQRGREFVALRLMTHIAQNFTRGSQPLSSGELARQLTVPGQLSRSILGALVQSGLLVEANDDNDQRFSPARPIDRISAYEVISALRAGPGQEPATAEDESRGLVRTEFERMVSAEREAGASVTLQSLAELTAKQVGHTTRPALAGAKASETRAQ